MASGCIFLDVLSVSVIYDMLILVDHVCLENFVIIPLLKGD